MNNIPQTFTPGSVWTNNTPITLIPVSCRPSTFSDHIVYNINSTFIFLEEKILPTTTENYHELMFIFYCNEQLCYDGMLISNKKMEDINYLPAVHTNLKDFFLQKLTRII